MSFVKDSILIAGFVRLLPHIPWEGGVGALDIGHTATREIGDSSSGKSINGKCETME